MKYNTNRIIPRKSRRKVKRNMKNKLHINALEIDTTGTYLNSLI